MVYAPMQFRNLYFARDAAHLVPATGAEGALHDINVIAQALASAV